jgi:hypothetical protein
VPESILCLLPEDHLVHVSGTSCAMLPGGETFMSQPHVCIMRLILRSRSPLEPRNDLTCAHPG